MPCSLHVALLQILFNTFSLWIRGAGRSLCRMSSYWQDFLLRAIFALSTCGNVATKKEAEMISYCFLTRRRHCCERSNRSSEIWRSSSVSTNRSSSCCSRASESSSFLRWTDAQDYSTATHTATDGMRCCKTMTMSFMNFIWATSLTSSDASKLPKLSISAAAPA